MFKILIALAFGYLCGWFFTLVHQAYLRAKNKSTAQMAYDAITNNKDKYLFIRLEEGEWEGGIYGFAHRHSYNLSLLDLQCISEVLSRYILPDIEESQDAIDFLVKAKGLIK